MGKLKINFVVITKFLAENWKMSGKIMNWISVGFPWVDFSDF